MATTLSDIRFKIEPQIRPSSVENKDIIDWCNEANADIGMDFNLPATTSITLTTTDLQYLLPTNLKIINRLRLQSVIDEGLDREFGTTYRIYNGYIILPRVLWIAPDTLVVDYYKHLTVFTAITDNIELDDRYALIYVFYGLMKFYEMPEAAERIGAQEAERRMQSNLSKYNAMKSQLSAYQGLSIEPTVIEGRW